MLQDKAEFEQYSQELQNELQSSVAIPAKGKPLSKKQQKNKDALVAKHVRLPALITSMQL